MTDIEACAHIVHKHGDIILVVDNTFMSAYFQVNERKSFCCDQNPTYLSVIKKKKDYFIIKIIIKLKIVIYQNITIID